MRTPRDIICMIFLSFIWKILWVLRIKKIEIKGKGRQKKLWWWYVWEKEVGK